MNVYIIHQYGEPEHFRALTALKNSSPTRIKLYFGDFLWKKDLLTGLTKADLQMFHKGFLSIFTFIKSIFDQNGVIIYALEPGHKKITFIAKHYSKRKLIYFTSAAEWDWNAPLLKAVDNRTKTQWDALLKKSHVVHVNYLSAKLLSQYHTCKRVTVIPHSIETSIYNVQKRGKPDPNMLHVLYAGKIVAQKGISDILWCAQQLINKPICFHCIGAGEETFVKKLRHASNIKYYGHITDKKKVAGIMQQMDILVLPSYKIRTWEELFGMVIIEAMACGAVPVATDCIGPKCIIKHQENGILIPQKNRNALLGEIIRLSENRTLLASMQKKAVLSAAKYTTDRLSESWASILFS